MAKTKSELKRDFVIDCWENKKMTRPEICDALAEEFHLKIGSAYQVVYVVLPGSKYQVPTERRRPRGSVPIDKRTWNNRYNLKDQVDDDDVDLSSLD